MLTEDKLANIFETHDFDGNEPDEELNESSDSDEDVQMAGTTDVQVSTQSGEESEDEENEPYREVSSRCHKIKTALLFLDTLGLKLDDMIDGMSWGDEDCTLDAKIRNERTQLLRSSKLPGILKRWAMPPRPKKSKAKCPEGASATMNAFALEHVQRTLSMELEDLATDLHSPTSVDVEKETLTGTTFKNLLETTQTTAPLTWKLLQELATRPSQKTRNTQKDPVKVGNLSPLIFLAKYLHTRSLLLSSACSHIRGHITETGSKNCLRSTSSSKEFQQKASICFMRWHLQ